MPLLISTMFWLAVYIILVLAPLLVLKFGKVPPGLGFWWDFSMALGFAGLSMMGIQFILTARFKYLSAPYGIDIIYFFHRYLAIIAFTFILIHPVIIYFYAPNALQPAHPADAPGHMTAGRIALVLFVLIIVSSMFRKQLKLSYEYWRLSHVLLTTTAFILSIIHVAGVGYYIEAPLKRILWMAYSFFWLFLIIDVRLVKPWQLIRRPYRVVEVRPQRGYVHTLVLAPENHAGLTFKAGQFAWLSLQSPFALREHPFSFSSSPASPDRLEFTIKELGDFTRTIKTIKPGSLAYVDGPYGNFTLERFKSAPALVFVAGGVGIAPIMSILLNLSEQNDPRPVMLFYGNEDWERVTFREELENLQQRSKLKVIHVLKQPPENWQGEAGLIDQTLLHKYLKDGWLEAEFFICGPGAMRTAVESALSQLGVPMRRFHSELFELV